MGAFANNLRWLRLRRSMTQAQLASHIRVKRRPTTASYISRLEGGRLDVRLSTLLSLARALRVSPALLLTPPGEARDIVSDWLDLEPQAKREIRRLIRYYRAGGR